jgi:hypothetical protein
MQNSKSNYFSPAQLRHNLEDERYLANICDIIYFKYITVLI